MHLRLQQRYGIKTSRFVIAGYVSCSYIFPGNREEVRLLLGFMDPGGVALRRKRRLNRRVYTSKVAKTIEKRGFCD